MDDLIDLQRKRREVQGYLELGLLEMAEEILDSVSPQCGEHPLVLDGRLALLMERQDWKGAIETGLRGCAIDPGEPAFFIHTAFCLHEAGRTAEALLLLESGRAALRGEPLFHYNVGCYLARLGRGVEAMPCLAEAFRLDASLREYAKADRDLEAVWPLL